MALDHLLQPIRIGSMELRNRIITAPMGTGYCNPDGSVSQRVIDHFLRRAEGGAGLLTTGIAHVHPSGRLADTEFGVWDDSFLDGLRLLTDAVHSAEGKISLQIAHGGRYCRSDVLKAQPVAPSAVPCRMTGETPRELTTEEVQSLITAFVTAGLRAKRAGFDAIEICACTGYLISQFLSPVTNKRSDRYGGDIHGRAAFLIEIIARIRELVGPEFPIFCKLSVEEYMPGGNTVEETKLIVPSLVEAGASVVHAWAGWHEALVPMLPMFVPRGAWVFLAEALKRVVPVPVVAVGRINDPVLADEIIAAGRADLVAFGRGLLADPDLPRKAAEGRLEDIRKCIACNRCFDAAMVREPIWCSVNASLGFEPESRIRLASRSKKVLVIGSGPAGMEAARVAAERGHQVTIWEREAEPGGALLLARVPPDKGEVDNLRTYLVTQLAKLGVVIELNKKATPESVKEAGVDAVVVACGAEPVTPGMPGIRGPNVVAAIDILADKASTGKKVVVLGGGLIGCEASEFLHAAGKEVTIVEMIDRIGADIGVSMRWVVLARLRERNIRMLAGTRGIEVTGAGLLVERDGVQELIPADTVVIAAGMRPSRELAESLAGIAPELYTIGDCVEPGRILEAVHAGARAGRQI
ncbi:MAG: FAD-dependent oxidoreductase [Dehalococcoidia bacterium]|nr:FAD-dependent oxidoreductase [Dehalococcoidia bacterium]